MKSVPTWRAGYCVSFAHSHRDLKLEGAKSALPIWTDFMKEPSQIAPHRSAHDFRSPSGVVSAQICSDTGELAGPACPRARSEVFIDGAQPATVCTTHSALSEAPGGGQ